MLLSPKEKHPLDLIGSHIHLSYKQSNLILVCKIVIVIISAMMSDC